MADTILVLGVNHKTTPVEVREKLAFSGDCSTPLLAIHALPGCQECCLLSTCNRVEVYFVARNREETERQLRAFLFAQAGLPESETHRYVYVHQGADAVHHIFRVAGSLDSMIVGEPQILGQLKDAYQKACDQATCGVIMNKLLTKAFSVAKRIRTETNIGSSAVSISYAAVELAKKIFGDLRGKRVMLVGAGEMAELAAEHLVNQGIAKVVVANRTLERAMNLARRFNGSAVTLDELVGELVGVDILISSTGAPGLVLLKDQVKPVMRQRRHSPLFLIDIAVPRDLDPRLNDIDNVYLYDIDDLNQVVETNKAERDKEAVRAERIASEETMKFLQWLETMEITPTIIAIREKAEAIRSAELARTMSQLGDIPPKQKKAIEVLTSSIINKILHDPILFLKNGQASQDDKAQRLDLTRRLFGLDREQPPAGKPPAA
ncbi:MAG: glutamyl-tRNA reductase [Thermodesulfobacteriota bacterium]